MSVSTPSKEVYVIDVPEVKQFDVVFNYAFHVPDESVSDTSGYDSDFLSKKLVYVDESSYTKSRSSFPRSVRLTWKKTTATDYGNAVDHESIARNVFGAARSKTLITDNYDKILYEDIVSSKNYACVTYTDNDFDKKLYSLISGSYQVLSNGSTSDASNSTMLMQINSLLPSVVDRHVITDAFANTEISANTRQGTPLSSAGSVQTSVQHSSRFARNIVSRSARDPFSPSPFDSARVSNSIVDNARLETEDQLKNKTIVPYIAIVNTDSVTTQPGGGGEIVGYVIEKSDVTRPQSVITYDPIVIESDKVNTVFDPYVKYGSTYQYAIRTIALFKLPAIDVDTDQLVTIVLLISSRPTVKTVVAHDKKAPPPPNNIDFSWNYDLEKLIMHWSFPVNSQRDIKRFQVFRRAAIDHPYQLVKEYDFDDSRIRIGNGETPNAHLVEKLTSPVMYYVDDDFDRSSMYMYTACSIDAHGLTSNYGEQFYVKYDNTTNKLTKKLVSHSGAPKQYPNMYVSGLGTRSSVTVSGEYTKNMQLFFTPQFYNAYDANKNNAFELNTNQNGGAYKFNFVNLDNQKNRVVTVKIEDRRKIV